MWLLLKPSQGLSPRGEVFPQGFCEGVLALELRVQISLGRVLGTLASSQGEVNRLLLLDPAPSFCASGIISGISLVEQTIHV